MTTTRQQQPRVRQFLLERVAEASRGAAEYPSGWARETMQTLAGHLRSVARVFELDPTLMDEPENTERFRVLWLIDELARMCRWVVRYAVRPEYPYREDKRAEAEALLQRIGELITRALVVLPYPASPAGQARAAAARLAARYENVQEAADQLRAAVADTVRLNPDDDQAKQLSRAAVGLVLLANQLRDDHHETVDALNAALGLDQGGQGDDQDD